jgi:hypothetical protein
MVTAVISFSFSTIKDIKGHPVGVFAGGDLLEKVSRSSASSVQPGLHILYKLVCTLSTNWILKGSSIFRWVIIPAWIFHRVTGQFWRSYRHHRAGITTVRRLILLKSAVSQILSDLRFKSLVSADMDTNFWEQVIQSKQVGIFWEK